EPLPRPSAREVADMILRHAGLLLEVKGEYIGIREIRKHAAWYTAGYKNSSRLRGRINEIRTYGDLERLLEEFLCA
ncbi:MAG: tRNA-dihydrouridine synthase, partial [Lachnospiraceae bacterium]|nr:tRNA-dihydrouridine synthase [Lachnospiraceae bacterium]